MRFVVVYDACVLYPAPLRHFLIRLASTELFAARWTRQIHEEWIRNLLAERTDLLEEQLQQTHAQIIVTFNLKDFPEAQLAPFGVEAMHPDRFIECQMDLREAAVVQAAKAQRATLKNPPQSASELLDTLAAQGLPAAADRLREFERLI